LPFREIPNKFSSLCPKSSLSAYHLRELKRPKRIKLKLKKAPTKRKIELMSTHASILVDSVGPPSAEVCRTAASFP
jgi:hypothetical protein